MHIGLICDEYPPAPYGGSGAVFRDLAEGLVAMGNRVTVVGISCTLPISEVLEETIRGVRVIRLPRASERVHYRVAGWWDRLRLRRWLRRVHRQYPFDLLECSDYHGWLSHGGIPGIPTVVRMHGSNIFYDAELDRTADAYEHAHERACLSRATQIVSVSRYASRRTLILAGLDERRGTVIHNAVDTDAFSPGPQSEIEPGLVLYVNTLSPRKGIGNLIAAANLIFPQRPHTRLVVVGEDTQHRMGGRYLEQLREQIAPALRERIIFTGQLEKEQIIPWLRRAAVCCYPSLMETFGIAPLEAMAVGRPTVFTRLGPGPELIEDGVSGLLCDPRDPADIGRSLVRFLDDPVFAERLGCAARLRAVEHFAKGDWIVRNSDFYARVCTGACVE